jgi:hypothetical protein
VSQTNVVPSQKIEDAAAGNKALRDMLTALAATTNQQQQVTSTSGKNVPQQVKATVSYLKGNYIVEIQNPGAVAPASALQAAQASAGATTGTNTQSITAIYHQIRCATSPQFNISSQVQTFGGDTGSTQTYWTLTNLPSGRFYFQVRSSFDGVNWNLWRNANGGQTITTQPDGVTVEATNNAVFGLFELPGHQLVAFGAGLASNGGSFGVPQELYTSAMQAIPGPDGYVPQPSNLAHGIVTNTISLVGNTDAVSGPPDFPTLITQLYEDGEGHQWGGTASIFAFCYDPLGTNVTEETVGGCVWVDFILPGGAHLTIGTGVTADGGNISLPDTMPWVTAASLLTIVSPSSGFDPSHQAHGISEAAITGTTLRCAYMDGSGNRWGSSGNWFAVSISGGYPVTAVANGNFIVINLPSGTKVAIGAGRAASGTAFGLPAGFTLANMLSIATPASFNDSGHPMAGVFSCGITGTTGHLSYSDTENNYWDGNYNWMAFAWM